MQTINQTEISKRIKQAISATDTNRLIENAQTAIETAKETSQAKFGAVDESVGTIKNGVQGLSQVVDNAADESPTTEPAIAKLDPSIANKLNGFKNTLSTDEKNNIDAMFKSTLVDAEAAYAQAAASIPSDEEMLKEVITDGSIEAIADTVKDITTDDTTTISSAFEGFKSESFTGQLQDLVDDITGSKLVKSLTTAINTLDKRLTDATGSIQSGNFLKDFVENATGNIQSELKDIGLNISASSFSTRLLNNDVESVKNDLSKNIPLSSRVRGILNKSEFKSFKEIGADLAKLKGEYANDATIQKEVTEIQAIGDKIGTKIKPNLGTIGKTVVNEDNNSQPNNNPVVTISDTKVKPYKILNSVEEIVKYFQATEREISTMIVDGGNRFLDQSNWTAEDLANDLNTRLGPYIQRNPEKLFTNWDFTYGKAHIFVRKDGTIETSRPLEMYRGGDVDDLRYRLYSFEITFNAGWNCTSDTRPILPSHYSIKSWTPAQWKAFDTLLTAFYIAFPYGDVWGLGTFNVRNKILSMSPGFDVTEYIARPPWNKTNSQLEHLLLEENLVNNKAFLSPYEAAEAKKKAIDKKKNELNDVQ